MRHLKLPLGLSYGTGWLAAFAVVAAASAYVHAVVLRRPVGLRRLAAAAPVLAAYALLPWVFDPMGGRMLGTAVLFCVVTWVASFRLLAACWARGPLVDPAIACSTLRTAAAMSLPLNLIAKRRRNSGTRATQPKSWVHLAGCCTAKTAAMVPIVLMAHRWHNHISPAILDAIFSVNLYLFATAVCEGLAAPAVALLGIVVASPFEHPYLALSLEDFWARRWNLVVSGVLRDTVYQPLLDLLCCHGSQQASLQVTTIDGEDRAPDTSADSVKKEPLTGAAVCSNGQLDNGHAHNQAFSGTRRRVQGQDLKPHSALSTPPPLWARLVAMQAAFVMSGVMHELAVYYLTFSMTGDMLAFFTLHGAATVAELALRKLVQLHGRPLPRTLGRVLTLSFAFVTGHLLFFRALRRSGAHLRALGELRAIFMPL
eukprot:SM000032S12156  [mRNA]  locus=s32:921802:923192:- [translate_table: standard]